MKKYILISLIVTIVSQLAFSDTMVSVSSEFGSSDNIFNDSFAIADSYSNINSDLLWYPNEMTEINFFGDYNLYHQTEGLSNLNLGGIITYIPTDIFMKSQIYLVSSFSYLKYGNDFEIYNKMNFSGTGSWNYQLSLRTISKIGVGLSSTKYTETSSVKDNLYYVYTGFNTTLFNSNSIDCEVAYYTKDFSTDDSFNSNNSYIDLSMRYSRPLSSAVGLSMNYLKRFLDSEEESSIPGFTIDYLSPWSTLWSGDDLHIALKTFLPKQVIMSIHGYYSEKSFVDQIESDLSDDPVYTIYERDDKSTSYSLSMEKKFYTRSTQIIPRITVSYINNNSTLQLYDYTKFLVHGALSVNF